MKIVFFNDTYHPYVSGVITAMERFAQGLHRRGHQVSMVVPGDTRSPMVENVQELLSIPVPGFDGLRIGTPILADGHLSLSGSLDRELDLVHAHSPFIVGRMGARLAEKRRIPLVFTCHSLYPNYSDYFPWISDVAAEVIREYVVDFCSYCDLVLAPSGPVKDTLQGWGVRSRIDVLPSGIDWEEIERARSLLTREVLAERRRQYQRTHGIPQSADLLLFVGRMDHRKNISFLFSVLEALPGSRDVHLALIGDGPAKPRLEQLVRQRGLTERVHFIGKMPFAGVIEWYHLADLFCFPSLVETQGLVLAESMGCGLPVVALDSPTSKEVVQPEVNGLLVKEDPRAFADAVQGLLLSPEERATMSVAARLTGKRFSLEPLTEELASKYMEVIRRKRRLPRLRGWRMLGDWFDGSLS